MYNKIKPLILAVLCLSLLASGCSKSPNETINQEALQKTLTLKEAQILDLQSSLANQENISKQLTAEKETLQQTVDQLEQQNQQVPLSQSTPLSLGLTVIQLLETQDMTTLATYIHPTKGVRFSPYGYVDAINDLVFTAAQISTLLQDPQNYTWGSYDGSGDPITKTFANYYDEFVYDEDFANPHMIGNNVVIGTGNSLINIAQEYPNGQFIEFHFTGFDPQYSGIDWVSLRLVFEDVSGTLYLVGIIHDQWTI